MLCCVNTSCDPAFAEQEASQYQDCMAVGALLLPGELEKKCQPQTTAELHDRVAVR